MRAPKLTVALLILLVALGLSGSAAAQTPPGTSEATAVASGFARPQEELAAPEDVEAAIGTSTQSAEVTPAGTRPKQAAPLSVAFAGAKTLRDALVPLIILGALAAVLGVDMKPARFPSYPEQTPPLQRVPLPDGLPEPVARFYQVVSGDTVPVIRSAVISGTAPTRLRGFTLNSRFRFTHEAGRGYHHYIESTAFRRPVLRVNEWYLNGKARLESSAGTTVNEAAVDRAANLGMWGESLWLSPVYLTDSRVRWQAIDAHSARLIVPFGAARDSFTVFFDPQTGLIARMEAVRSKSIAPDKVARWILLPEKWRRFHGLLIPSSIAVMWEDEGVPWAVFRVNDVTYNVDVTEYVRARGL